MSIFEQVLNLRKNYYRLDEAAMAFGVRKRSVQRYMEEEKLPYVKTPGGQRRIPWAALNAASGNYVR